MSNHQKHKQLQSINVALNIQLEDSERELKRLQDDGKKTDMVRSIMVEKLVSTMPYELAPITPSLMAVQYTLDSKESTPTPSLPLLSMEMCIKLWSAESKVFPQFKVFAPFLRITKISIFYHGWEVD